MFIAVRKLYNDIRSYFTECPSTAKGRLASKRLGALVKIDRISLYLIEETKTTILVFE